MAQVAERLLCGTQSGSVGYGTRQDTCHRGNGSSRSIEYSQCGGDTQRYHNDAEHVETSAAILERREETGAHLKADGVNEEYQSELLQKVEQVLIEVEREMTEDKTDEKNPGQA